jgi:glycosyltransferase involved in cell wall biosynthesis
MVRKEGLDIVEAPDWTGLSAGMRLDCPLVIRCHGSDTYFGKLQNYKPRWSVHLAEKMGLQGADGIVSVSKFTADVTQEIFNIDMPIEIIPNGINPNLYSTDFEKGEEGLVLYFGTLVRKKGVLDLAKIFSFVVNENPKAKLLLIGRDTIDKITGRSTWELMQKEMSEEALCRMKYIGAQPHDKMKQWISKAVVCVFPSYAEALPVSWLEAMACAKPVIASNIGWGPEIIENGVNGLLIHPTQHTLYSNAILQLLGNHEERSRLGIAARKKVERSFDIMMTARQSAEWYQGVIDELADRNHR